MPNSKFISDSVVNWTLTEKLVRFKIPVTVEYGPPFEEIERVLVDCLRDERDVARDPPPSVRLMAFGENGLELEVRAWSTTLVHRRGLLTSTINRALYEALRQAGIRIAGAKRDVRLTWAGDGAPDAAQLATRAAGDATTSQPRHETR